MKECPLLRKRLEELQERLRTEPVSWDHPALIEIPQLLRVLGLRLSHLEVSPVESRVGSGNGHNLPGSGS